MAVLHADEIRARVEADFDRIVDVLNKKIALQSISAKGITADHMKQRKPARGDWNSTISR